MKRALLLLVLALMGLTGCVEESTETDTSYATDSAGPLIRNGASSEVWAVTNAWGDRTTTAAKKAGMAWPENSGLSWEEKYDKWVQSLETMPDTSGNGTTISLSTPYGDRKLPGPKLECAEVAIFLRATFASWYHLPFFLTGWDSKNKQMLYAGHFGFINKNADIIPGFQSFNGNYKDYEKTWKVGDPWPSDANLRKKRLGSDDTLGYVVGPNGEELGAGAYFDDAYLNKRTGHFMRLLLLYFGSVNLADESNMFHIQPEATSAGDVLLERWQKIGIGHTIPVLRVNSPIEGKLAIDVATGSMPRRQPRYEDALQSRRYFTMVETGGEGNAYDGNPYAKLGGGIRRWRTAAQKGGRWNNEVSADDKPIYISPSDLEAIAARPKRFEEIIITGSPEEEKAALLSVIGNAREHILAHPASCSARETREKAFISLYGIADKLGTTKAALDAELRVKDDYIFAPLVYVDSKTCCWNSTTPAMAEIIIDYARVEKEQNDADMVCREPTPFRSQSDGYALWANHAQAMGRAADWLTWTEDEPCSQKNVAQDKLEAFEATPSCSLVTP